MYIGCEKWAWGAKNCFGCSRNNFNVKKKNMERKFFKLFLEFLKVQGHE